MYCPNCGNKLPDNAGFCNRCGKAIVYDNQDESYDPESDPYLDEQETSYGQYNRPDSGNNTSTTSYGQYNTPDSGSNNTSTTSYDQYNSPDNGNNTSTNNSSNTERKKYLIIVLLIALVAVSGLIFKSFKERSEDGNIFSIFKGPGSGSGSEATTTEEPTEEEPTEVPPVVIEDPPEEPTNEEESLLNEYLQDAETKNALEHNGHVYAIFDFHHLNLDTFDECQEYCRKMGGHLAVINSEKENYAVYSYVLDYDCEHAFFGFTDEYHEGHWEWVDGSSIKYTNWGKGQPNNKHGREDYAQFCGNNGIWNDANFGSESWKFICEWDYDLQ